jgi:EAL domain-containing protein (putative c-di-GMP-specific phosphodiesterase class I)
MSEPPAISRVTKRIIENISKPYILDKKTANVGASIGITIFPDDGTTSTTMMKNADLAMYHAKSSGKNQFQFFSANMNTLAMAELSLERDLRYAIDHLELKMYYQPKIDLITKKIVSVEALIRWFHPEKGFISPAEFIPIAEDTGLIIPIGEWIIDSCCQQLKHWQNTPAHNIPIAINISGIQFRQKELDTFILSTLKIYHLPTHLLEIEVTETAIVHSENNANKILDSLKNAGLKIWMDDFGTGYSSLSYLRKFPVYGVKIDCSFIKHIASSESDYSLCSAIISLAESLHLQVIAEGIETEDQEVLLKQKNCRYGQGFLYYKAVTPEEILRALQQQE